MVESPDSSSSSFIWVLGNQNKPLWNLMLFGIPIDVLWRVPNWFRSILKRNCIWLWRPQSTLYIPCGLAFCRQRLEVSVVKSNHLTRDSWTNFISNTVYSGQGCGGNEVKLGFLPPSLMYNKVKIVLIDSNNKRAEWKEYCCEALIKGCVLLLVG